MIKLLEIAKPNEKQKIIDRLIKGGWNKKQAIEMVNSEYDYVAKKYANATVAKKAEVIMSIYNVDGVER